MIIYGTEYNELIAYDMENNFEFEKRIKEGFTTCLEFDDTNQILIAGLSNGMILFLTLNFKSKKFETSKKIKNLCPSPIICIKAFNNLNNILIVNFNNKIILGTSKSKNKLKYKFKGIARGNEENQILNIKVLNLKKELFMISLTSVNSTQLFFLKINSSSSNKLIFLDKFDRAGFSNDENTKLSQSFFSISEISQQPNEIKIYNEEFKSKPSTKQFKKFSELLFCLKKKLKPLYGMSSIFWMNFDSSKNKILTISILGKECEICVYHTIDFLKINKSISSKFEFDENVFFAAFFGNDILLIIFDTMECFFFNLVQFYKNNILTNYIKTKFSFERKTSLMLLNSSKEGSSFIEESNKSPYYEVTPSKPQTESDIFDFEQMISKEEKTKKQFLLENLKKIDIGYLDLEEIEIFQESKSRRKLGIISKNNIKIVSLKKFFDYLKELYKESNYISVLFWINEFMNNKLIHLFGIGPGFKFRSNHIQFIIKVVDNLFKIILKQDQVSFIYTLIIEVLIKINKIDILFDKILFSIDRKHPSLKQYVDTFLIIIFDHLNKVTNNL